MSEINVTPGSSSTGQGPIETYGLSSDEEYIRDNDTGASAQAEGIAAIAAPKAAKQKRPPPKKIEDPVEIANCIAADVSLSNNISLPFELTSTHDTQTLRFPARAPPNLSQADMGYWSHYRGSKSTCPRSTMVLNPCIC